MKRLRRAGEDQGSAAVEFALVLPLLLLLVFAIIDFGRMLNARIVISQAAHEGARALAVTDDEDTAITTVQRVMGSMAEGMEDPGLAGCDGLFGGEATVVVTYQFQFATPLALFAGFGDDGGTSISSTAVVPCL